MYEGVIKRRTLRGMERMPESVQKKMANFVEDLRNKGPLRKD